MGYATESFAEQMAIRLYPDVRCGGLAQGTANPRSTANPFRKRRSIGAAVQIIEELFHG